MNNFCDECETCAHCLKEHKCVFAPKQADAVSEKIMCVKGVSVACIKAIDGGCRPGECVTGAEGVFIEGESDRVSIPLQWFKELMNLCGPEDHELRYRVTQSARYGK